MEERKLRGGHEKNQSITTQKAREWPLSILTPTHVGSSFSRHRTIFPGVREKRVDKLARSRCLRRHGSSSIHHGQENNYLRFEFRVFRCYTLVGEELQSYRVNYSWECPVQHAYVNKFELIYIAQQAYRLRGKIGRNGAVVQRIFKPSDSGLSRSDELGN